MRKICLGMVGLTLCTLSVMAQSRKVTGRVVSKEDGEPIIGASIIAKGTSIGTVTDFDGNFTLDVPNEAGTLVISYIGMATQNVKVQPLLNISMEPNTKSKDSVPTTEKTTLSLSKLMLCWKIMRPSTNLPTLTLKRNVLRQR